MLVREKLFVLECGDLFGSGGGDGDGGCEFCLL